ncbi:hypothetical protein [Thiocystis violacea]|uniref:hypothetical protein n=1 Tax=Thiocystis violacea TaxID=13725 RepID=UPI001902CEB1|nr:hypothetical protein [Thiocystis violacea]MBK1724054.1 hypothetical protein [Thiocystis violacea]
MRIQEIQSGMLLGKDVYDPNGHILMRAGVRITERHIKAFKSWGIQEASIAPDADGAPEPVRDPKAVAEIHALLDTQFSLSNRGHPVVEVIYDLCLQRALGKR